MFDKQVTEDSLVSVINLKDRLRDAFENIDEGCEGVQTAPSKLVGKMKQQQQEKVSIFDFNKYFKQRYYS